MGVISVRNCGARGDGGNADDAFAQAISAAQSSNDGTVLIPAGRYVLNRPISITSALTIRGEGWGAASATRGSLLLAGAGAGNLFSVNTTEPVSFENFEIRAQPGVGVPVYLDAPPGQYNSNSRLNRVLISGGNANFGMGSAIVWTATECCFANATGANVWIRNVTHNDGGDSFFANNLIGGTPSDAHVLYQGGGGLKMVGNKLNGVAPAGLRLQLLEGFSTGVLIVNGNSIEGQDAAIVLSRIASVAHFRSVSITGNELGSSARCVWAPTDPGGQWLDGVSITGNNLIVTSPTGAAVDVDSISSGVVTGNTNFGPPGSVAVRKGAQGNITVGVNAMSGGIA